LTPPGVVAFVSPGCRSCAAALATVEASGHPYAVVDEAGARRAAGVTEVPTVVEVDGDGVVLRGWVGPLPAGAFDAGPPR
jgi:glutaredoxin